MSGALNGAIDDNETGSYVVTRTAFGTRPGGKYVSGAVTTLSIVASVQPLGSETKDLPEGVHTEDLRLVITATEMMQSGKAFEADQISILGVMYRVWKCDRYDHWGETHFEVTVVKTEVP